jgi:hypothetical protein
MFKSTDIAGVSPLVRVSPLLSVAAIGDPIQALDARAAQFAQGKNLPLPSFAQIPDGAANSAKNNVTTANFSLAAYLIDNALKQAEAAGVTLKYEAQTVITQSPKVPAVMAQDLKNALSNSGLFYESHLTDYVEGHRTLADLKQEPQNQFNSVANSLLPQQLAILETQRLVWHGEVWPGQKMDWDIYLQNEQESANDDHQQAIDDNKSIASDLTLHLPHLGKVTAKLSLVEGRVRISVLAEEAQTLSILKAHSKNLANAIEKNGQILEGLAVVPHA